MARLEEITSALLRESLHTKIPKESLVTNFCFGTASPPLRLLSSGGRGALTEMAVYSAYYRKLTASPAVLWLWTTNSHLPFSFGSCRGLELRVQDSSHLD